MRRAIINGHVVWVDDFGRFVRMAEGGLGGAEPGMSSDRYNDMMSRLPDAQVAGLAGHGVVPVQESPSGDNGTGTQALQTFRPLAGLASNYRGGTVIMNPVDDQGNVLVGNLTRNVIQLPTNAGQDAEVLSLVLGLETSPDPSVVTDASYKVTAALQFGIGGASFSALMDWDNGKIITVPASFLSIDGIYAVPAPVAPDFANPPQITLSAAVGYGAISRSRGGGAKFTVNIPSIDSAGESNLGVPSKIPNFATGLSIQASTANPNLQIWWLKSGLQPLTAISQVIYDDPSNLSDQSEGTFAIPNGAHYFIIFNNGIQATTVQAIFSLSF